MAFSTSAFAVDVKVGADYYVGGLYLNKSWVANIEDAAAAGHPTSVMMPANPSTAFFFQRLRVGTDFVVSPSLKLVTRFDAMERVWGGDRSIRWADAFNVVTGNPSSSSYNLNAGMHSLESQNINFEIAYIDYTSPIGLIQVGYMPDWTWGTVFGNRGTGPTAGQIKYIAPVGPVYLFVGYAKEEDHSKTSYVPVSDGISGSPSAWRGDRDFDSWRFGAIYNFNTKNAKGEVGGLFLFNRDASNRGAGVATPLFNDGYLTKAYKLVPYFKAQVGPVALQGEAGWMFGEYARFNNPVAMPVSGIVTDTIKLDTLELFLDANANFGMFSVGGSFAYLSGDKNSIADAKINGGVNTGGLDWNPCLILFNNEVAADWVGGLYGWMTNPALPPFAQGGGLTRVSGPMSNAWFYQLRAGVKPTKQLDVQLAAAYAQLDKKAPGISGDYGVEIDLVGTYKITNNLSYMLGFGYLFTGDYFKGSSLMYAPGTNEVEDIYMLINKLTLSF